MDQEMKIKRLQHEIAEREQAQRASQENHESILRQERLAADGQLTGGLAHEFNNIMTVIRGHASLLRDSPNLDKESAKSLAHITNSVERMAELVRQMLAFSRQQAMPPQPLDVGATLGLASGFPVTDRAPQRPVPAASLPEARGGNETVLVAEDERVLRELVREILTARGYRVLEAADGVEALNLWDENRQKVDVLLTDIAMPRGLSGRDLAEKLRQDDPSLPVIFSSGHSQEMSGRSDDTVHGATYLSKPYLPADLAQAVRHALDAGRNGDTAVAVAGS
jgi:CheY-like chemotaxis protein